MVPLYQWLQNTFQTDPSWTWVLMAVACLIPVGIVWMVIQGVAGASTWVERKIAADIQRRVGPNQCNPGSFFGVWAKEIMALGKTEKAGAGGQLMASVFSALVPVFEILDKILGRWAPGLLIFLADGIKLLMKESIVPASADKPMFKIAPAIVLASAFGALACVPYSSNFYIADFNIGIFYLVSITSLETVGILMAGWASNNKWALLGGMRSAAQIVSYELPTSLAVLTGIILSGTMSMQGIVYGQFGPDNLHQGWIWQWNIFSSPFMLALAPVYFLAVLAECNRTPFDIPEAESELVAGYHTEYTGINFAFFFMAEYTMMCVLSAAAVTIFLGGWSTGFGWLETRDWWSVNGDPHQGFYWWASLVHLVVFAAKTYGLVFIMMWIRWTIPRYRVDQMMTLCWKKLIPVGMACFTGAAVWLVVRKEIVRSMGEPAWADKAGFASLLVFLALTGWLLWFFSQPLSPEEAARRRLLREANLNPGVGQGVV